MRRIIAISLFTIITVFAHSQQLTPWGKNFWVSFMPVPNSGTNTITLHITTQTATTITITNPINNYYYSETVLGATIKLIDVPVSKAIASSGVSTGALKIQTSQPTRIVAVHNTVNFGLESIPIFSESFSGRNYFIMSTAGTGSGRSAATIIATQDNTTINITPTEDISTGSGNIIKGSSGSVTIDKGEVLMIEALNAGDDISGTHIEVDEPGKKVVVYSGATMAKVPSSCGNTSNVAEPMFPVEIWGKKYIASKTGSGGYDLVKIVASEDNTTVQVDGVNAGTINKGESIVKQYTSEATVSADKPIATAILSVGLNCSTGEGAPTLTSLAPWENKAKLSYITVPQISNSSAGSNNYICIVTTTVGKSAVKLDGVFMLPGLFTALSGDPTLSMAYISVPPGNHEIDAFYGATVYSFGYGSNDAYGAVAMGVFENTAPPINSTDETEFWSSFHWDYTANSSIEGVDVTYTVSSAFDCNGKVYNPNSGWYDYFSIKANVPKTIYVPEYEVIAANAGKSIAAVKIVTDMPSQVYAQLRDPSGVGTAVTNLIPLSNLSKQYMHTSADSGGKNLLVVATEDNTQVEIRPFHNSGGQAPINIVLDKGEVYLVQDNAAMTDLTGSTIRVYNSCNKVAVFSGGATDHPGCKTSYTLQQAQSAYRYGEKFIIPYMEPRDRASIKVSAYYNGSIVNFKGSMGDFALLNRSQYKQDSSYVDPNPSTAGYTYIDADSAIQVYTFASASSCYPGESYPFMCEVYGLNYMQKYACFTIFDYVDSGYINVVTTTKNKNILKLNGVVVNPSLFTVVAEDTNYCFAKIKVAKGNYVLQSDSGYSAFVYGMKGNDGFGYSLGYDYSQKLQYEITVRGQTVANVPGLPSGGYDAGRNLVTICGSSGTVEINADFTPDFWHYTIDYNTQKIPGNLKSFGVSFGDKGVHQLKIVPECEMDTFKSGIQVFGFPEVDAGIDTMACPYDTIGLKASGGVKYWWWNYRSVSDAYIADPYTIVKFDNILGVFITDSNNCTNFDLVSVDMVDSALVIPYFNDTIICSGDSILIGALGGEGDVSKYTYIWDHGLPSVYEHMVSPDTTTTYMVVGIYPCGSFEPDTAYITVKVREPLSVNAFMTDTAICEGDTVFAIARGAGGDSTKYKFTWMNSSNQDSIQQYNPLKTTTYWAVLNDGCSPESDTAYATIKVVNKNDKLDVYITGDTFLCKGQKAYVKAIGVGGQSRGYTYSWDNGLPPRQEHTINTSNKMTIRVTLTDGCIDKPATAVVNITFRDPIKIHPMDDIELCSGDSLLVKASGEGSDPRFYNFKWSHGLPDGDSNFIKGTQSKTITVTINDDCGDKESTQFGLIVQPNPIANFIGKDTLICVGDEVRFTDLSVIHKTPTTYAWDFGDGGTSTENTPTHQFTTPDSFDITLKLTSPLGCKDSITKPLHIKTVKTPIAFFMATPDSTDIRTPEIVFTNQSTGGINYAWTFGDGTSDISENPIHTYSDTGTYKVTQTVVNDIGCYDTYTSYIYIDDFYAIYIPSAFTPNQNNLNEEFKPIVSGVRKYEMTIYNRWGELLFKTDDSKQGWDGNYKGEPVPSGSYVYIIYLVDKNRKGELFKGSLVLIR